MSSISYLLGMRTDTYVLMAADTMSFAHNAFVVSDEHKKAYKLGDKLQMMCIGEPGDVNQFAEFVEKNLQLYKLRNGYEIGPQSAHHWIRAAIVDNLRTRDYYLVDTLIGGYDEHSSKPYLGMVDHLGTYIDQEPYMFRGFGLTFSYAILDKIYKSTMTEEEGIAAMKMCLGEVRKRLVANLANFMVVIIDRNGIRRLPDF